MAATPKLTPAAELVGQPAKRFPNESDAYRKARNALLVEEIELRRHLWRVAEQRAARSRVITASPARMAKSVLRTCSEGTTR